MAGLFVLLAAPGGELRRQTLEWIAAETPYDSGCATRVLLRTVSAVVGINAHESYPWSVSQDDDLLLLLDGVLYNRTEEQVLASLRNIGQLLRRGLDCASEIRAMVEEADGEFVACVLDKRANRALLFNDSLGRLSLYHAESARGAAAARDLRVLLPFMPALRPDRTAAAEIFMYGFPLGTRTLFEGISCLDPGHGLQCEASNRGGIFTTSPIGFDIRDPFRSRAESLAFLVETYRESVRRRVRTLGERGFALLADLSGGFDTRAVLAGLAPWTRDVTYCTFGYVRDESRIAEALFEAFGRPGRYERLPSASRYDFSAVDDLLFRTDGLVNYYTTLVCHADVQAMKRVAPTRAARFNGLGGEFIRHPYRNLAVGFSRTADALLYSAAPAGQVGAALGMPVAECLRGIRDDLGGYPEASRRARLRRLYYFYYDRYVGYAGGERERGTFWGVSPLWSRDFANAIFTRIPLAWIGFPYFTEFMNALDPRLLSVPLYGSATNLTSASSVRWHHRRYYLSRHNSIVKNPAVRALAGMLRRAGPPASDELMADYEGRCERLQQALPREFQVLDVAGTRAWPLPLRRRVVTLLTYWNTVQRRVPR